MSDEIPGQEVVASHSMASIAKLIPETAKGFIVTEIFDEFLLDVLAEYMPLVINPERRRSSVELENH